MDRDINFTILTGTIASAPAWVPLSNSKRALVFTLQNNEHYQLSNGEAAVHQNSITVEVLGRNAEKYASEFVAGQRCQIVGYLRMDMMRGQERIRVRAFKIEDAGGNNRSRVQN